MNEAKIVEIGNCTIVYGALDISTMCALTDKYSKNGVMNTQLSKRLGATMVMGEPDDIKALETHPEIQKQLAEIEGQTEKRYASSLPAEIIDWLIHGERGASSESIVQHLTGVDIGASMYAPSDAYDLRRCVLLLEAAPWLREKLHKMAEVSAQWRELVAHWNELEILMREEMPGLEHDHNTPKTYKRMKQVLAVAEAEMRL